MTKIITRVTPMQSLLIPRYDNSPSLDWAPRFDIQLSAVILLFLKASKIAEQKCDNLFTITDSPGVSFIFLLLFFQIIFDACFYPEIGALCLHIFYFWMVFVGRILAFVEAIALCRCWFLKLVCWWHTAVRFGGLISNSVLAIHALVVLSHLGCCGLGCW